MGMESHRNKIANANSHTHCQAAQAHAKTQAWQRVCLSQRSTETTYKLTNEKEQRRHNITYTQYRVVTRNELSLISNERA
jgi:hypothetical protein